LVPSQLKNPGPVTIAAGVYHWITSTILARSKITDPVE
jgi:hypothetical protein